MGNSKESKWLQYQIDKFDLADEFFDMQDFAMNCSFDLEGAKALYDHIIEELSDNEDFKEAVTIFKKNETKMLIALIDFIDYAQDGLDNENDLDEDNDDEEEEVETVKESANPFATPKDKLTPVFSSTGETIQPQLSDKAFKYLYSWDELKNRTKDAAWLYDQAKAMLESGEKLDEVEKIIEKLENDIKKFAEFYRKRFEIKLGYLRTELNERRSQTKK